MRTGFFVNNLDYNRIPAVGMPDEISQTGARHDSHSDTVIAMIAIRDRTFTEASEIRS